MHHRIATLFMALALVAPVAAAPVAPSIATPAYRIGGFRHAHFGMTPAEVRAAIATDFGGAIAVTGADNNVEGTTALQAIVPAIAPGPGAATVSYIFGATSQRLTHVNVVWQTAGAATPAQRDAVAVAAVQLADYFRALPIRPRATASVTALDKDALLMFAAVDDAGAAVELIASGLSFKTDAARTAPSPDAPAVLRISYAMNAANPDVRRLAAGSF